jgi:hypothetical protein
VRHQKRSWFESKRVGTINETVSAVDHRQQS